MCQTGVIVVMVLYASLYISTLTERREGEERGRGGERGGEGETERDRERRGGGSKGYTIRV